ncbi:MAG: aldehyde dehydrogenase family protein, partial [Desulfovibrionales bacterium]|nr:aldehyde dehydrogenase family protein [Desulfovibrionales bacterium]
MDRRMVDSVLGDLGIAAENNGASLGGSRGWIETSGPVLTSYSPIDGKPLASVRTAGPREYEQVMDRATEAFKAFSMMPAPRRGQMVRDLAQALRDKKEVLGALISLEVGKIRVEGEGEVQEMIDIADFALGLSRQLYGLTMHSERPEHR